MHVIVTRARDDAVRTAARLAAAGHDPVVSPLFEILPTGAALPQTPVDAIFATSVHALAGVQRLPSALAGTPWLVVGERLAAALRRSGFGEPEAVAPDVAALIAAVAQRYPEPFRFLYLAGRDRKPDLERELKASGHDVHVVETYVAKERERLEPAAVAALSCGGGAGAVLHFSRRSAELFVAAIHGVGLDAAMVRHIAISEDAATPLRAQSWPVTIADSPTEDAMLAALSQPAPNAT